MLKLTAEQREQIQYARTFLPWSTASVTVWNAATRGREQLPAMTDEEIWGVLEICSRKHLNPADNQQVSVIRDKNGIQVVPGFRVMINWLDSLGPHSAVKYTRLIGDALKAEGSTDPRDLVYKASVVMFNEVASARAAGIDAATAIEIATHTGVGRVSGSEYLNDNGKEKPYAAANGRTPADKAKKRAFIDLISDLGGPTDEEFRTIATVNRGMVLEDRHFEGTQALPFQEARALATFRAELENPITTPETRALGADALFGEVVAEVEELPTDSVSPAFAEEHAPAVAAAPPAFPPRPLSPAEVQATRYQYCEVHAGDREVASATLERMRGIAVGMLARGFTKNLQDQARHLILEFLFGNPSSRDLSQVQISSILDWTVDSDSATPEEKYPTAAHAIAEMRQIYEKMLIEAGQTSLDM